MSTEEDIKDRINKGLINDDLAPIKCTCWCIEFDDIVKDRLDGHLVLEFERNCKDCGTTCGYWAHGFWMS
jgi:hypothetical protein